MKNYTVYHLHTDYSNTVTNIDSVTKPQHYINRAKELGMKAIAFSEHGTIADWVKKKDMVESAGLKYIHGVEAYITKTLDEKVRDNYHVGLYAKNFDGVLEINNLISNAFNRTDNHFYYVPRISFEELISTSENIIITTSCIGGVLARNDEELKEEFIKFLVKNKERCFLEVQHHQDKAQIEHNLKMLELSKATGLKLIAGTDTHALDEKHAKGRKILQRSKNIFFEDEEGWDITFKTYDELVKLYQQQNIFTEEEIIQALENTNVLADMVEEFEMDKSFKYPKLVEDGYNVLRGKIYKGIIDKGINLYPNYNDYIERIKYELEVYKYQKMEDFLLLDADIKDFARANDIFPGCSRGSVAGSVVAYLIGITEIDPIKEKLNFERFVNKERVSLGDVDSDYPPSKREFIKDYIFNKEGLYCADIITFNTVALKGSIRDCARALNISLNTVNEICADVETRINHYREQYKELFEYVDIINGTIVSMGTHPCFLGHELITTDKGYKAIKEIQAGDKVLTHNNRFKEVEKVIKSESSNIFKISSSSSLPTEVTGNHPMYIKTKIKKKGKIIGLSEPYWKTVEEINTKDDLIGIAINQNSIIPNNKFDLPFENLDFWWIIGRYFGDGWLEEIKGRTEERFIICCKKDEKNINDIKEKLDGLFEYRENFSYRTAHKIFIKNKDLKAWIKQFGKYAHGKKLTNEIFDLPKEYLESFLNGYFSSDGHFDKKTKTQSFKTVSKELALGIIQCIAKVYNRHCTTSVIKARVDYIEGRKVNCKECYSVSFTKDKRAKERSFYEDGYIWSFIKSIELTDKKEETYNLSVYDDNSYCVNNLIAHNCGSVISPIHLDSNMGTLTLATSERPVTMLSMKAVDSLMYVKLDILSLDNIEIINETCKLAGIDRLTPDNVPQEEEVWLSIAKDTTGIFQWESDLASKYIEKLFSRETIEKIKSIYPEFRYIDLFSVGNGAIRPAGASYRDLLAEGIFRDNGHEALNKFLASTLGYLVYQEQIIEFLNKFCGYTMGEADTIRRAFAKKLGTEQYIPDIKNGFIKTMKEEYNVCEEESEKLIVNFLQVIIDASDYLFSLNHSQAYSYIGYICAYLKYYYPLEYFTVALNQYSGDLDKTAKIMEYLNKHNIKVENPTFGKSKAKYFCDKETNVIYKGIESVKFLNTEIADNLYNSSSKQYDNFVDLYNDVTGVNRRQWEVLIKIGYFRAFGTVNKLLKILSLFDEYKNKNYKKEGLKNSNFIKMFAESETEKMYRNVDTEKLIKYIASVLPNEKDKLGVLASYQAEYMGNVSLINPEANKNECIVLDVNTKYTPTLKLYRLQNGDIIEVKVSKKDYFDKPLQKFDNVYVASCNKKQKIKKVDNEWVKIDEYNYYITYYKI